MPASSLGGSIAWPYVVLPEPEGSQIVAAFGIAAAHSGFVKLRPH